MDHEAGNKERERLAPEQHGGDDHHQRAGVESEASAEAVQQHRHRDAGRDPEPGRKEVEHAHRLSAPEQFVRREREHRHQHRAAEGGKEEEAGEGDRPPHGEADPAEPNRYPALVAPHRTFRARLPALRGLPGERSPSVPFHSRAGHYPGGRARASASLTRRAMTGASSSFRQSARITTLPSSTKEGST